MEEGSSNVAAASHRSTALRSVARLASGLHRTRRADAPPELRARLTLEFRESLFSHYDSLNLGLLSGLRKLGVSIGVDHFGLSSEVLSRLHELRLDYVKVDRRFIRNLDKEQGDRFYLRTLESACRSSDTQIIVEGVERQSQLEVLESLGFRNLQGFYFGTPKNEHEFELGMRS